MLGLHFTHGGRWVAVVLGAALVAGAAPAQAIPIPLTGTFIATGPTCGTGAVVCDGVGTSQVSWGDPVPGTVLQSSLSFTPSTTLEPIDIMPGRVITLGTLTLVNGTAALGSWINSATLAIDMKGFADDITFVINTVNTLCVGGEPREVCADYIHFRDSEVFGSFGVWEGFHGTVEVKALVGSLILDGFGNVVGVGTANQETGEIGPSIDPGQLPPDLQPAFRYPSTTPPSVPEPTALLLIGVGLAAFGRRRAVRRP